jgi:hypothetical protein
MSVHTDVTLKAARRACQGLGRKSADAEVFRLDMGLEPVSHADIPFYSIGLYDGGRFFFDIVIDADHRIWPLNRATAELEFVSSSPQQFVTCTRTVSEMRDLDAAYAAYAEKLAAGLSVIDPAAVAEAAHWRKIITGFRRLAENPPDTSRQPCPACGGEVKADFCHEDDWRLVE